ncbi:MAG: hypothetical protein WC846_02150 [Candidatus Gracilibacteria bacterium]|jgi:hypothetical protein
MAKNGGISERKETRGGIEETGYVLYCRKMDLEQRIRDIKASSPDFNVEGLQAEVTQKKTAIDELAKDWAKENKLPLWNSAQETNFEHMLAERYLEKHLVETRKEKEAAINAGTDKGLISLSTSVKGAGVAKDAEGSLVMAADNLLRAPRPFNLDDLISGNRREDAIRAVYPKETADALINNLSDPVSPKYQETLRTLVAFKATLAGTYNDLKELYMASDQVTNSTIDGYAKGKLSSVLEEVKSHPGQSWTAGICILAAIGWTMWKGDKKSDDGKRGFLSKALPWFLGITGVAFGADLVSKGALRSGLGLSDGFEKLFGTRPDVLITPEILEKIRASFKEEKLNNDAVDDLLTIIPVPAVTVAEAFELSVPNGKKIDKSKFTGQVGVKAMNQLEGDDLYMACDWGFYECGKIALAEDGAPPSAGMSHDDIALEGAKYVERCFPGRSFGALLIELKLLIDTKAAQKGKEAVKARNENRITDTHLAGLAEQFPSFRSVLRSTGEPEVYRVKGYPFKYYYNERGEHEFKDCLNSNVTPIVLPGDSSRDTLSITLTMLAEKSEDKMVEKFKTFNDSDSNTPNNFEDKGLLYVEEGGFYKLVPPLDSAGHKGLPGYKPEPMPVVVYADSKGVYLGLDTFKDFEPDATETPYKTLKQLQEAYDKQATIKNLVKETTGHLLFGSLGTDYEVTDVKEFEAVAGTPGTPERTVVTISYGRGSLSTAKLEYSNDELTKVVSLAETPELTALWKAQADAKVKEFIESEDVRREIEKITPEFGSWIGKTGDFFVDIYKWFAEDSTQIRVRNRQEQQVVDAIREMLKDIKDDYVKEVFRGGVVPPAIPLPSLSAQDFENREKTFFDTKLKAIKGYSTAPITKGPDKPTYEFADDGGKEFMNALQNEQYRLEGLLKAFSYRDPTTDKAWYKAAFLAPWNVATASSVKKTLAQEKVEQYVAELRTRCVPLWTDRATEGKWPTNATLKIEADKVLDKARTEAAGVWGKDDVEAVQDMMLDPIRVDTANFPKWEEATKLVAEYLTRNLKWEKYAFLPAPENMVQVMQLWYKNIRVDDKTLMDPAEGTAKDYADYFIWNVYKQFGTNKDFSVDRLYSDDISSVSGGQFNDSFRPFSESIENYDKFFKLKRAAPQTPDMDPANPSEDLDMYCESIQKNFWAWYEKDVDCGSSWKRDHEWPKIQRNNVARRLSDLLARDKAAGKSPKDIKEDAHDFGEFVAAERWSVFEPLIQHGIEPKDHGDTIERKVIDVYFPMDFGLTIDPATNSAYQRDLSKYVDDIFNKITDITGEAHDGWIPSPLPHGVPYF